MTTDIYEAIFDLNKAANLAELLSTFKNVLDKQGFDLFAVQHTTPQIKRAGSEPHYLSNFADEWVRHYYTSRYFEIDPVIKLGKQKREPYRWDKLWEGIEMSQLQKEFFNEAEEFGVASGIGFPIFQVNNEPGIVSFVSSHFSQKDLDQIFKEKHYAFALLATNFHNAAARFFEKRPHPGAPHLTLREKECLLWASKGKTDREIGMLLGSSHRTVNTHMQRVFKKLECCSREQAIVQAIYTNLIEI